MKIGVFDSGVGGKSFVAAIHTAFAEAIVVYKEDKANLPYGDKTPSQLFELTLPIFREFEQERCDAVLIACNSVTTNCIEQLRAAIALPLVGVEPMIKPAAQQSVSKTIAVLATPATLKSKRYAELKNLYGSDVTIIEPDCSNWASLIEQNRQNELQLKRTVTDVISAGADVLVLGCTHYHWIEDTLQDLAGERAAVIQPIEPVIAQLRRIIL